MPFLLAMAIVGAATLLVTRGIPVHHRFGRQEPRKRQEPLAAHRLRSYRRE